MTFRFVFHWFGPVSPTGLHRWGCNLSFGATTQFRQQGMNRPSRSALVKKSAPNALDRHGSLRIANLCGLRDSPVEPRAPGSPPELSCEPLQPTSSPCATPSPGAQPRTVRSNWCDGQSIRARRTARPTSEMRTHFRFGSPGFQALFVRRPRSAHVPSMGRTSLVTAHWDRRRSCPHDVQVGMRPALRGNPLMPDPPTVQSQRGH
jgi:hypothetical protein